MSKDVVVILEVMRGVPVLISQFTYENVIINVTILSESAIWSGVTSCYMEKEREKKGIGSGNLKFMGG
jgi:hypothetical protein